MIIPVGIARIARLIGIAAVAVSRSHALVGDWTSFTHLNAIRDMEASKGSLFVATTGGIRKILPSGKEKVYRNTEGLRDVGIASLATDPEGEIYAASELGYIYHFDSGADDWEILGTSYRGAGWKMNKRAMLYRAGYLVLGTEKGLSFFNLKRKVADANVTKLGSISGASANALLFQGDTLFVGTSRGIFKAVLHLEKLLTDPEVNIFNPSIWSQIPGTEGFYSYDPAPPQDDTAYEADSLNAVALIAAAKLTPDDDPGLRSHGLLIYGSNGIASEYEGKNYPDGKAVSSSFGKIRIEGYKSYVSARMEAIFELAGTWYTGNANGLYRFVPQLGDYYPIDNPENIPIEGVTALRASRNGVFAMATPNVFTLRNQSWTLIPSVSYNNSASDTKRRGQHAFDVVDGKEFFVGTWGSGFFDFHDGIGQNLHSENSCLPSAVDSNINPNLPVIWSQSRYQEKGLWLGIYISGKPFHIGYFDFSKRTITCFEPNSKDDEPRNLQVVGDTVLAIVTKRGIEAFRILDAGGAVSLDPANRLAALADPGEPTLVGKADNFGNFWLTTESSHLFYVPSIAFKPDSVQSVRSLDGFSGSACMNLERDPQGHLWAGCTEGGIFEITPGRDSLSHSFRKYGLNEGLLSEVIYHLDVNPDNGDIWVATEKGLARYESTSRPLQPNLSSVKVYPNPFLAKHAALVFDHLASGSEVQVTTQSGSVVFHHSLASGSGDQIRWDGRNMAGERVREGVYFYVIRSPKETKNGKIIVAR